MAGQEVSLWIMALLYVAAGVNHFVNTTFYKKIIPPFLPAPGLINIVSGAAEIVLGILLLVPSYTSWAAWGIIALLIAVFPANIYHFIKGWRKKKMIAALAIRLPLQGLLVWWAYSFI